MLSNTPKPANFSPLNSLPKSHPFLHPPPIFPSEFWKKLQFSGMAKVDQTQALVINYRMNKYRIMEVRSDAYTHLQLLSDVSDLVLRDVPSDVSICITLNLPIPGTYQTMEVKNDTDLKTMFELYSKSENIDIILRVTQNPPLVAQPEEMALGNLPAGPGPHPNWLSLDDVRRKGNMLAEEEPPLSLGQDADLAKLAGMLRTQIIRSDGNDEFRSDYRKDLRLHMAILKAAGGRVCPFGLPAELHPPAFQWMQPAEQLQAGAGPDGEDGEVDQWLNLNDSADTQ